MSAADYAAIENRLRRMADRQSLQLVRSRRRARGTEPCKYMLIDPFTSAITTGGDWSLDLADVEHILLTVGPAARRANARDCPACSTPTYTLSGLVKGARVDERECPICGYTFVAQPSPPPHADRSINAESDRDL
jgi:Zn ribbon nucleic-acid-binding protein